jgi:hypothetical protein
VRHVHIIAFAVVAAQIERTAAQGATLALIAAAFIFNIFDAKLYHVIIWELSEVGGCQGGSLTGLMSLGKLICEHLLDTGRGRAGRGKGCKADHS